MSEYRKKLIEVALPLIEISDASAFEKTGGARHGHPSTLHFWWARRPVGACRTVLFGQLVDDPSAWPEHFPREEDQDRERQRLFRIIQEAVKWENSTNEVMLGAVRLEIARSMARSRIADGSDDQRDIEIMKDGPSGMAVREYIANVFPPVHDPFSGGGSIPLEAQRLGLRAIATDLNPVAVMITKALIELPPKFVGRPPVGAEVQESKQASLGRADWSGTAGLAEDVRRYGHWMREEAFNAVGHLHPLVDLPEQYGGGKATVIAWIWARTVESPDPAFRGCRVPLITNFFLATKKGRETWLEPVVEGKSFHFEIRTGTPKDRSTIKQGTKLGRGANFRCLLSNSPIEPEYVKKAGSAGQLGATLIAVVAEGNRRRVYLPGTEELEALANCPTPEFVPDGRLPANRQYSNPPLYGLETFGDLFTNRQLVVLNTLSDLVLRAREQISADARAAGWPDDGRGIEAGGDGATAYGDALCVYLAFAADRFANASSSLCSWDSGAAQEKIRFTFARQAFPMTWDFAETNPFSKSSGNLGDGFEWIAKVLERLVPITPGRCTQADARSEMADQPVITCTDPPYYDNVPYADLSDFFYVWLRRSLSEVFPSTLSTIFVPKEPELVANPVRQGGRREAEEFFLEGMSEAISAAFRRSTDEFPTTIYYAFKQSETGQGGTSSTGWETFLEAVLRSGYSISGTLPLRTELANRMRSIKSNALASSIVLVCRKRSDVAEAVSRGEFRRLLRSELPLSLHALQKSDIAPVDLAQASLGPGMAIFSRHREVVEADGSHMSVRSALQLINEVVDEVRGEEESLLDSYTRFAVTWYETHGYNSGAFGEADTLAKARNISVAGVVHAGILISAAGKVRLLPRAELPESWDPTTDERLTVWEATQHLIRRLDSSGESEAALLLGGDLPP